MEIAMAAHSTQASEPHIKVVAPYPGRLLKARLKRMQKASRAFFVFFLAPKKFDFHLIGKAI